MYKHIKKIWKSPKKNLGSIWQDRLINWRRESTTTRIERPTRLDRARELGYKAKPGYIVVRQRVIRGGKQRPNEMAGRRPRHNRQRMVAGKNYRQICEERVAKKYPNCEVLNSYYVAQDGKYYWYEIILLDRDHPVIVKDKKTAWVFKAKNTRRVFRGQTSAAKKSRGLRNKGKGAEKVRPSSRANDRMIK